MVISCAGNAHGEKQRHAAHAPPSSPICRAAKDITAVGSAGVNTRCIQSINATTTSNDLTCQCCATPARKRATPHTTQSYRCRNCDMSFGRNRFPSADIRNFKQRKSGRLKCHTCRSGYTCSCCERSFSKEHWTTDQLKKHRSRKTPLRCKDCVASGHARRTLQTR